MCVNIAFIPIPGFQAFYLKPTMYFFVVTMACGRHFYIYNNEKCEVKWRVFFSIRNREYLW